MLLQLPDQVCQQPGPAVLYLNYGAPPLRPVPHAPLQPRQPAPGKRVKGELQAKDGSMKYFHNNMCLQEEFKSVILLIEEAILATDLAIYFKNRGDAFAHPNAINGTRSADIRIVP